MFRNFFLPGFDEALLAEICERAALATRPRLHRARSRHAGLGRRRRRPPLRVPVLHIAAARPTCPPAVLAEAIPDVVTGQTVGAGHFNMLEVPDQVNSMIEQFLRQYVT